MIKSCPVMTTLPQQRLWIRRSSYSPSLQHPGTAHRENNVAFYHELRNSVNAPYFTNRTGTSTNRITSLAVEPSNRATAALRP